MFHELTEDMLGICLYHSLYSYLRGRQDQLDQLDQEARLGSEDQGEPPLGKTKSSFIFAQTMIENVMTDQKINFSLRAINNPVTARAGFAVYHLDHVLM